MRVPELPLEPVERGAGRLPALREEDEDRIHELVKWMDRRTDDG